jgi:hypothetical protein
VVDVGKDGACSGCASEPGLHRHHGRRPHKVVVVVAIKKRPSPLCGSSLRPSAATRWPCMCWPSAAGAAARSPGYRRRLCPSSALALGCGERQSCGGGTGRGCVALHWFFKTAAI